MNKHNANEVIIYQTDNGKTQLEVNLKEDTVWLSQMQMTELFGRDQSVISRHLRNVFKENELEEKSNMQKMHIPNSDRPVAFYSLNVIISIGYRVKSLRGTQFRIWATNVLKEHLLKGYTSNDKRLRELQKTIKLVEKVVNHKKVSSDEEKSPNILYFLVKNHSFIDGNKRIAAFIFIWFLDRNGFLYNRDNGSKRIADNALVAITLMIAESNSDERETIVNVIINLINSRNE